MYTIYIYTHNINEYKKIFAHSTKNTIYYNVIFRHNIFCNVLCCVFHICSFCHEILTNIKSCQLRRAIKYNILCSIFKPQEAPARLINIFTKYIHIYRILIHTIHKPQEASARLASCLLLSPPLLFLLCLSSKPGSDISPISNQLDTVHLDKNMAYKKSMAPSSILDIWHGHHGWCPCKKFCQV